MILFLIGVCCVAFYSLERLFPHRLNVKAFISNVKTALAATNPVSKFTILILIFFFFRSLIGRLSAFIIFLTGCKDFCHYLAGSHVPLCGASFANVF